MKYNWPAVIAEFRRIVLENTVFKCASGNNPDVLMCILKSELAAGTFHPYGTDCELSKSLENIQKRCDYRNPARVQQWQVDRDMVEDAIYSMLVECREKITEYFTDPWNVERENRPTDIRSKWSTNVPRNAFARIHRAALSA